LSSATAIRCVKAYHFVPLDLNALVAWIVVTFVFIAVIGVLYRRVARAKKQEADERKDETPAY